MTEDELISIIDQEIANSVGYYSGRLADDRRKAMEYYYGEPFGNEQDGRSSFVSQDVADTIEWIMPALMKIFMSSEDVARFDPHGPEDEQSAQQVTDYVQYVFTKRNPGFVVLYSFFKDALLLKNGFVKVYWEQYKTRKVEEYDNMNDNELTMLVGELEDKGSEVEIERTKTGYKLLISGGYGKICVDPVPPDEVLVSKNANFDIQKIRCVTHRSRKSASELREMGYVVEGLSEAQDDISLGLERQTRFLHEQEDVLDEENRDPSSKLYTVDETYLLVDWDGDGIAERRQICKVGSQILRYAENGEMANFEIGRVPLETCTPIMMPHKLYGRSIAELIMDLQLLKSTLIRQILDNMYLTNNSRVMALDQMVNIDDLLTVRPGGIVRVKTFDAVKPLQVPFFGAPAFNMLGYVDQIRENRTGTRYFQGIDPDVLAKDTSGVALANFANAAMERIELVARIFAETGVKGIFWAIYELAAKHVKKPEIIRLRNKWVPIDPRGWAERYDVTVAVGLGTGSKEQFLRGSAVIGQIMKDIIAGGMFNRVVTEQNIYNFAHYTAEAVAPKKADLFFTDPAALPAPQPPPPDAKVEMQREKAYMADKTKRDVKAIDFLTQIAGMAQQAGQPPPAPPDNTPQYDHEMRMKKMEMEHDRLMQEERMVADGKPLGRAAQIEQALGALAEQGQQLAQAQMMLSEATSQLIESVQQVAKVVAAPRRLITDEKGEPIGAEPVLE